MRLRNIVFIFCAISILFAYTAESRMLGKNQAVYSGKLKKITSLKKHYKLSIANKVFFIKQTSSDNRIYRNAQILISKKVKIIYNKDNNFITFIGLLQKPLKY